MDRRNFLSAAATASAVASGGMLLPSAVTATPAPEEPHLTFQLWSRHLQWVSTAAQAAADPYGTGVKIGENCLASGFSAVDLTVRSGGHVEPTLVGTNLAPMLQGIRSTGCICDHIGANFAPPTDSKNTAWIETQFVHEILSVAAANGIRRYRFNNSGGASYAANTFGDDMASQLDGLRTNMARLAQIAERYGKLFGVAETHEAFNIGTSVWDYVFVMRDLQPNLIGINLAIGHTAAQAPNTVWQLEQRFAMPFIKCTALQDIKAVVDATTGALRFQTVPCVGTGAGVIRWDTFFQNLLRGGYSGAAEAQIEFSIVGAKGTTVSLNSAFFADNAQFVSGNLTPAIMIASMKAEAAFYRARAAAAGWTAEQMT